MPVVEDDRTKKRDLSELMEDLGRGAEALRNGADWQAMLRVQARFHNYSPMNRILIWCQMPEATRVAGYKKWQELGRQVQKGQKAIKILAPHTRTREDEVTGEKRKYISGFGYAKVFDISQTEGEDLPHVEWPAAGECPPDLFARLVNASVDGEHVTEVLLVDRDPLKPGARGWWSQVGHDVSIVHAGEPQMCSTFLHELGHAHDPDLTLYAERQEAELVAESVCYVLGLPLGVDVEAEAFHYIASWRGDAASLAALAERVGGAVKSIHAMWEKEDPTLAN